MRKVILAGAGGLVGGQLVQNLLRDNSIEKIIILVRKPLEITNPVLHQVIVDFDNLDKISDWFSGVDTVYCCLGTTIKKAKTKDAFRKVDFDYPMALARLSEQQGVNHFLCITAMGADPKSIIFYNKIKGEVEQSISKLKIPCITFFRPSLLIGNRKESRPGERIGILFAKATGFLFRGPLKNYRGITIEKVAKSMFLKGGNPQSGIHVISSGEMQ